MQIASSMRAVTQAHYRHPHTASARMLLAIHAICRGFKKAQCTQSDDTVLSRGTQIPGARTRSKLNFVWQCVRLAGSQYGACFMSLFWQLKVLRWRQDFCWKLCGFWVFGSISAAYFYSRDHELISRHIRAVLTVVVVYSNTSYLERCLQSDHYHSVTFPADYSLITLSLVLHNAKCWKSLWNKFGLYCKLISNSGAGCIQFIKWLLAGMNEWIN